MTTTTPPRPASSPSEEDPRRDRAVSGTAFVLVCATLAALFVLFLVLVSPVLLERARSQAPPPAPQTVAEGEVDGLAWAAVAYDGSAHLRGVDEQGVEAVVEEEPCLRLAVAGVEAGEICVLRRGGSIRDLGSAAIGDGTEVVLGIVAPTVSAVTLFLDGGSDLEVAPTYVDYGFPLGFFAVEVDAGVRVTGARAVDRNGVLRATADCEPGTRAVGGCTVTEGDY